MTGQAVTVCLSVLELETTQHDTSITHLQAWSALSYQVEVLHASAEYNVP